MPISLTSGQRRRLARNDALVLPLAGLKTVRRRTYWNQYGEPLEGLPADAYHLEFYLSKGWTLSKPPHPKKRPNTVPTGSSELTPGEVRRIRDGGAGTTEAKAVAAGPTATFYTQDGTAVPGLPADPESMKAYLEMGFILTAPATVSNVVRLRSRRKTEATA
jgi:hypothetical protein